jgi:hypothetical protein
VNKGILKHFFMLKIAAKMRKSRKKGLLFLSFLSLFAAIPLVAAVGWVKSGRRAPAKMPQTAFPDELTTDFTDGNRVPGLMTLSVPSVKSVVQLLEFDLYRQYRWITVGNGGYLEMPKKSSDKRAQEPSPCPLPSNGRGWPTGRVRVFLAPPRDYRAVNQMPSLKASFEIHCPTEFDVGILPRN